VRYAPVTAAPCTASLPRLQILSPQLFPVVEESEEDLDACMMAFPTPVRRRKQVRMRTKSVRYSRAPPGLDLDGEEFGPPILVVPPPAVIPLPYAVTTVVAPLSEHEFDLELGGAFANGKGVEYECGEWLPGIQLESR
jgi:hypothetical protein